MLEKATTNDPSHVDVTFVHSVPGGATSVCVVGDFNGWSSEEHPMAVEGNEARCTITLPAGTTHRFRYLLDGERWENDWQADGYAPNDFGGDDSVVDLTVIDLAGTESAPAKSKKASAKRKSVAT